MILAGLTLAVACAEPSLSRVRVAQGQAHGVVRDGVRIFRSLPYAAPPVGGLRFRGPRPAFVRTGNPNDANAGSWPRADVERPVFMALGERFAPLREAVPPQARAFWTQHFDANEQFRF